MKDSELAPEVRELIRTSIPTLDALELVMVLARPPVRIWTEAELRQAVPALQEAEFRQCLTQLTERRLVAASSEGFMLAAATVALQAAVAALCLAYNERPVTLIRTVYAIADERKLQSFADAFRLKRDI